MRHPHSGALRHPLAARLALAAYIVVGAGCGAGPPPSALHRSPSGVALQSLERGPSHVEAADGRSAASEPPNEAPPLPLDDLGLAPGHPVALEERCEGWLVRARAARDRVVRAATVAPSAVEGRRVLRAVDDLVVALGEAGDPASLLALAHPDGVLRKAASACVRRARALEGELLGDARVLRRLQEISDRASLDPDERELLDRLPNRLARAGAGLEAPAKRELAELDRRLSELGDAFLETLDEVPRLAVAPSALAGTSEPFRRRHPPELDGLVRLAAVGSDASEFLVHALDREAARRLHALAVGRGGKASVARLEGLLEARQEKARLLGHASWGELVIRDGMAGDPARAVEWVEGLTVALEPKVRLEVEELRGELRRVAGAPRTGPLRESDRAFAVSRLRRRRTGHAIDELAEYFTWESVLPGAIDVVSEAFGFRADEVGAASWADGVRAFELRRGDHLLGRIYFDGVAREDKPSDPMTLSLRRGRAGDAGARTPVVAVLMALPGPRAPMPHDAVVALFHELGHALAAMATEVAFASFFPLEAPPDQREVVPQVVEDWAWSRVALARLGRHRSTGSPLPEELLDAVLAGRRLGRALSLDRQVFFARLDLALHLAPAPVDLEAIVAEVRREHPSWTDEGGVGLAATFPHLVGYDAAYYGYSWSMALADAALARLRVDGRLDATAAEEFRRKVLARGAARSPEELVAEFVGRELTARALVERLASP